MRSIKRFIMAAVVALWLMPAVQADVNVQGGHTGPKTDALRSVTVVADTDSVGDFGPASAIDDRLAAFDGTTGKLIQDSGYTAASLIAASGSVLK